MGKSAYPLWLNIVLFQSIWFLAVLGQEKLAWLIVPLLAIHVWLVDDRLGELRLVAPVVALGVLADSVLALTGVFVFEPAPPVLPLPLWLVGYVQLAVPRRVVRARGRLASWERVRES